MTADLAAQDPYSWSTENRDTQFFGFLTVLEVDSPSAFDKRSAQKVYDDLMTYFALPGVVAILQQNHPPERIQSVLNFITEAKMTVIDDDNLRKQYFQNEHLRKQHHHAYWVQHDRAKRIEAAKRSLQDQAERHHWSTDELFTAGFPAVLQCIAGYFVPPLLILAGAALLAGPLGGICLLYFLWHMKTFGTLPLSEIGSATIDAKLESSAENFRGFVTTPIKIARERAFDPANYAYALGKVSRYLIDQLVLVGLSPARRDLLYEELDKQETNTYFVDTYDDSEDLQDQYRSNRLSGLRCEWILRGKAAHTAADVREVLSHDPNFERYLVEKLGDEARHLYGLWIDEHGQVMRPANEKAYENRPRIFAYPDHNDPLTIRVLGWSSTMSCASNKDRYDITFLVSAFIGIKERFDGLTNLTVFLPNIIEIYGLRSILDEELRYLPLESDLENESESLLFSHLYFKKNRGITRMGWMVEMRRMFKSDDSDGK